MHIIRYAALFAGVCSAIFAYDPPADTAGPLTVRMQPPATGAYGAGGYAELSRPGVPFVVPVTLQNAGETRLNIGEAAVAVLIGLGSLNGS